MLRRNSSHRLDNMWLGPEIISGVVLVPTILTLVLGIKTQSSICQLAIPLNVPSPQQNMGSAVYTRRPSFVTGRSHNSRGMNALAAGTNRVEY